MGSTENAGDRFRLRLRAERERRGWSQGQLADKIGGCYASTIAKIEAGTRGARLDEVDALADIFGISVDVLIGRTGRSADLAWAMSKLTSNAQKAAGDLRGLSERLTGDVQDIIAVTTGSNDTVANVMTDVHAAAQLLRASEVAMTRLSNQFPIPMGGIGS